MASMSDNKRNKKLCSNPVVCKERFKSCQIKIQSCQISFNSDSFEYFIKQADFEKKQAHHKFLFVRGYGAG